MWIWLVDRSLFHSPSLRSRQFVDHSSFLFWLQMTIDYPSSESKFENLWILTSNASHLGSDNLRWPRKPLYVNHGTKSFILVYSLSRFENFRILTRNDPKYPQIWGRVTSTDLENHVFVITGPKASFWYIICPGLNIFVIWPQMTPNTPKWRQPPTCKIENLY